VLGEAYPTKQTRNEEEMIMKLLVAFDGRKHSVAALDKAAELAAEAATAVAHGDPADEIVRSAESGGYDAIVLGTRTLGPVPGRILRSVSREVAQRAPGPVIVAEPSASRFRHHERRRLMDVSP
jgi:nucleotide-binding universal stress UspA family protein